jgi:mono/diheme cytochrome c family protein
MTLIGPKARLLNKEIDVAGEKINQLTYWSQKGLLQDLPESLAEVDLAPDWRDETKDLTDRAKAYLDINCAHCHRPEGAASLSGLKMEYRRKTIDYHHGVCNSAHGWRGGGFDIWPGDSEKSSMPLRMTLSGAPDRMPPLGRSLVDNEAVELIRQWIDAMPYQECAEQNN